MDFVKDHEQLYGKTNEHFKHKARKECLGERFHSSRKLSGKVCKTWFPSQRNRYGRLTQSKCYHLFSGQGRRPPVFCNYLASEVEALEERYFQTFRN